MKLTKKQTRMRRLCQLGIFLFISMGVVMIGGNELNTQMVSGSVLVIIGMLFWIFQDDMDWEEKDIKKLEKEIGEIKDKRIKIEQELNN